MTLLLVLALVLVLEFVLVLVFVLSLHLAPQSSVRIYTSNFRLCLHGKYGTTLPFITIRSIIRISSTLS
jgi:hypothetical protein